MTATATAPTPVSHDPWWVRWNIAAGNLFFHTRNAVFPILFALALLVLRPRVIGGPEMDRFLVVCGMLVAIAGQLIRLVTIGFEYIERGGKNRQIYASFLAQKGMYAVMRNPMYVGNALIATGLIMVTGSPAMSLVVWPFFLFVYQAITSAEERYLRNRFGEVYEQYCARVPRFFPSWKNAGPAFAGMTYQWRRAIRKDLGTITGLLTGLILLPVWRVIFLDGWVATTHRLLHALIAEAAILGVYGMLAWAKKRKWLFYLPTGSGETQ